MIPAIPKISVNNQKLAVYAMSRLVKRKIGLLMLETVERQINPYEEGLAEMNRSSVSLPQHPFRAADVGGAHG